MIIKTGRTKRAAELEAEAKALRRAEMDFFRAGEAGEVLRLPRLGSLADGQRNTPSLVGSTRCFLLSLCARFPGEALQGLLFDTIRENPFPSAFFSAPGGGPSLEIDKSIPVSDNLDPETVKMSGGY